MKNKQVSRKKHGKRLKYENGDLNKYIFNFSNVILTEMERHIFGVGG